MKYNRSVLKIIIFAFVAAILLVTAACGSPQTGSSDAIPSITPVDTGKAFIWEISSDENTVYVLGSIHMANRDLYPLDGAIIDAYDSAGYLVVEVDISRGDTVTSSTQLMLEYGSYTGGETLEDNIPGDIYNRLDDFFSDAGMPLVYLNNFKPWVFTVLVEEVQMQELGYSTDYGIDLHFLKKANEEYTEIIELETAEFQIELISSFSDDLMITMLEEMLKNPITQEESDMLFDAWVYGDIRAMEEMILYVPEEFSEFEIFNIKMLDERNYLMVEKIEELLAGDDVYFIVVGAGHLVGEEGIINLLYKRGYQTVQLEKTGR